MRPLHPPPFFGSAHGFTLAEVLLSLALLSGLATAIASWTVSTARSVSEVTEPLAWDAAAEATLDRIGRDLTTGDFAVPDEKATTDGPPPLLRVRWSKDGVLAIQTRTAGPCVRSYSIDPQPRSLTAEEKRVSGGDTTGRLLMTGVNDFTCEIDEKARTVGVAIIGPDDRRAERSYRVP